MPMTDDQIIATDKRVSEFINWLDYSSLPTLEHAVRLCRDLHNNLAASASQRRIAHGLARLLRAEAR